MRHPNRKYLLAGLLACAVSGAGAASAQSAPKCETLAQTKISAERIGLPTSGAAISQAQMVTPKGGTSPAHAYCLVSGVVKPVDPAAPAIRFQIALPSNWNSKALMLGGGGLDGVVAPVGEPYALAFPTAKPPVELGYVVIAHDGGQPSPDGAAFGNAEAWRNYIADAVKKTRDAAMVVIEDAYGRRPSKAYIRGGSKGGGETMAAVTRWPDDWDGAVAWFPMRDSVMNTLGAIHLNQALAAPGAYLDLAKRGVLHKAALEACDSLDGVRDGLISDEKGCRAKFDPATARLNGVPIRCPDGRDTGDTCLSDVQIAALKAIEAPVTIGFLPGGPRAFPGFNILTADLGASEASPMSPMVAMVTVGMKPATSPIAPGEAASAGFGDLFVKLTSADKTLNYLNFNLADPGSATKGMQALAKVDLGDADLSRFARRGGKLIIIQGTADMLVSPRATEAYDRALRASLGAAAAARSLRYYEVPGFGHGSSTVFDARVEDLAMLEAWVERGQDPAEQQTVTDTGHGGRTRPLCAYPNWPKYRGAGDPNVAASFVCATH